MNEEKLNKLQNSFSNNQKKLFSKICPLIGREASIALISLQGVEKASQAEIEVIANLIAQFKPIKIMDLQETPRRVTLSGKYTDNYSIRMVPQYKVANAKTRAQPWAVDLVIELYLLTGEECVKISSIGIEYDGYPAHYVESNIKATYLRDSCILGEEGISFIRISPDLWKKDPEVFKKAIRKYLSRQVKTVEKVQYHTKNECIRSMGAKYVYEAKVRLLCYVECPICEGACFLPDEPCPICGGYGKVTKNVADNIDYLEYERFSCPTCKSKISKRCHKCGGSGTISRENAIKLGKSKL